MGPEQPSESLLRQEWMVEAGIPPRPGILFRALSSAWV